MVLPVTVLSPAETNTIPSTFPERVLFSIVFPFEVTRIPLAVALFWRVKPPTVHPSAPITRAAPRFPGSITGAPPPVSTPISVIFLLILTVSGYVPLLTVIVSRGDAQVTASWMLVNPPP